MKPELKEAILPNINGLTDEGQFKLIRKPDLREEISLKKWNDLSDDEMKNRVKEDQEYAQEMERNEAYGLNIDPYLFILFLQDYGWKEDAALAIAFNAILANDKLKEAENNQNYADFLKTYSENKLEKEGESKIFSFMRNNRRLISSLTAMLLSPAYIFGARIIENKKYEKTKTTKTTNSSDHKIIKHDSYRPNYDATGLNDTVYNDSGLKSSLKNQFESGKITKIIVKGCVSVEDGGCKNDILSNKRAEEAKKGIIKIINDLKQQGIDTKNFDQNNIVIDNSDQDYINAQKTILQPFANQLGYSSLDDLLKDFSKNHNDPKFNEIEKALKLSRGVDIKIFSEQESTIKETHESNIVIPIPIDFIPRKKVVLDKDGKINLECPKDETGMTNDEIIRDINGNTKFYKDIVSEVLKKDPELKKEIDDFYKEQSKKDFKSSKKSKDTKNADESEEDDIDIKVFENSKKSKDVKKVDSSKEEEIEVEEIYIEDPKFINDLAVEILRTWNIHDNASLLRDTIHNSLKTHFKKDSSDITAKEVENGIKDVLPAFEEVLKNNLKNDFENKRQIKCAFQHAEYMASKLGEFVD